MDPERFELSSKHGTNYAFYMLIVLSGLDGQGGYVNYTWATRTMASLFPQETGTSIWKLAEMVDIAM